MTLKYIITILICFLSAIFFSLIHQFDPEKNETEFFETYQVEFIDLPTDKLNAEYRWLIENRLKKYNEEVNKLNSAFINLIILTVIGLLLMLYKPRYIEIPILSIKIPEILIYYTVIFGILYVWQNLGLQLNASIDSRLSLYKGMKSLISPCLHESLNYANEPSHILCDNGIVDNWCSYFFDIFKEIKNKSIARIIFQGLGLYGLLGTLFGVVYGVCFVLIIELKNRKASSRNLSLVLLIFALSLMICANYVWVTKHYYSGLLTAYYWFISGIFVIWWKIQGPIIINKLKALTVKSKNTELV